MEEPRTQRLKAPAISTVPVAHELFAGPRPATRVVPVGEESSVLGVDLPLVFLAWRAGLGGRLGVGGGGG